MKPSRHHTSHKRPATYGFTLLEMIVAMVVFGIAITGMFPLCAILSRDLLPGRAKDAPNEFKYFTPARDWESDTGVNTRHTWHIVPYSEPWARKLGASARITADSVAFAAYSGLSVEPSVLICEDSTTPSSVGGVYSETTPAAWSDGSGYRYHPSVATPGDSEKAVWTFTVAMAGWYSVQASWPVNAGQANDAQFKVFLDGVEQAALDPTTQDQTTDPVGVADAANGGRLWTKLTANPVYVPAGTIVEVTLNGESSTGAVVADGVRLVQNTVTLNSLVRQPNDAAETVTADVTINVQVAK